MLQNLKFDSTSNFAAWSKIFDKNSFQNSLYTPMMAQYYRAYNSASKFTEQSFVISEGEIPVLGVLLTEEKTSAGKTIYNWYGLPLLLLENTDYSGNHKDQAYSLLKETLDTLLQQNPEAGVLYRDTSFHLNPLSQHLLQAGATAQLALNRQIDITVDEAILKTQVRKSYKSLINWGEKNITWKLAFGDNISDAEFNEFKKLHIEVAGRETRSAETWQLQYKMLAQKQAFALFGTIEGKLETASYFNISAKHCFYSVSASNRNLFDKPLLHAAIWKAMLFAKSLGIEIFEMGHQSYPNFPAAQTDKKISDIATFKRGFGGYTKTETELKLGGI